MLTGFMCRNERFCPHHLLRTSICNSCSLLKRSAVSTVERRKIAYSPSALFSSASPRKIRNAATSITGMASDVAELPQHDSQPRFGLSATRRASPLLGFGTCCGVAANSRDDGSETAREGTGPAPSLPLLPRATASVDGPQDPLHLGMLQHVIPQPMELPTAHVGKPVRSKRQVAVGVETGGNAQGVP